MAELGSFDLLLLDGATGTELERRGVDVSLPLWSARALIDAPDVVEAIHTDYLRAGADAIVTNTFRTHRRSLAKEGLGDRACALTRLAVEIARGVRDREKPDALVLGSVAPLEDCYRPELAPSDEASRAEHGAMIRDLLDAGVDALLLETFNTRHEAEAAARVAREHAPGKWMISFCTKTTGPPGVLLHGPPLVDVLPGLEDAFAVGINCLAATAVEPQVRLLRTLLPASVHVMAYANAGAPDETGTWTFDESVTPPVYADLVETWLDAGATIVGGCCGTTPKTIAAVRGKLAARTE